MDYNVNAARCDTIWKCFLVTVDMGLRKGDIGGGLEDIQWRDIIPGAKHLVALRALGRAWY
eukprot:3182646-Rhodomonas_salina.1